MKLAVCIAVICASASRGAEHVHIIDPSVKHQVIDGFGASDCWSMQKIGAWSDASKRRVADLLFSTETGIGLSCWRFNLGGGVNRRTIGNPWRTVETFETGEGRYDWTRQANERWFLRAAWRRGVRQFVAFVNSPPGRMTRNGLTNCDPGPHTTNLKPGYERQFARYLVDILKRFRDAPEDWPRIAFDWVSPVNEPSWEWHTGCGQEGNRAGLDDIKAIIKALHAELARQEIKTRILAPEARSPAIMSYSSRRMKGTDREPCGDYLNELCGDPNVNKVLGGTLCYHSYLADELATKLIPQRKRLGKAMARYPGWKLWQSEYCVMRGPNGEGGGRRDLGMRTALNVARVIHYDLTLANVSAWQWWTAVSGVDYKDGLIYTDYREPGDPETVHESKLLWALGHFSRFVRPGMRRIGLRGMHDDATGLLGSAYEDRQNGRIVVVYVNMSDVPRDVSVRLAAQPGGPSVRRFTPYVTSGNRGDDLRLTPGVSPDAPFTIPARALVTLVGH